MTFGCLLVPVFIAGAALWIFGPTWGWIPFITLFSLIILMIILARPTRMKAEAPITTHSFAGLLSIVWYLTVPISIGVIVRGMYWELGICAAIFIIAGPISQRLHIAGGEHLLSNAIDDVVNDLIPRKKD